LLRKLEILSLMDVEGLPTALARSHSLCPGHTYGQSSRALPGIAAGGRAARLTALGSS